MKKELISLDQLPIGSFGRVKKLTNHGITRRRMLDLGLIHDTIVESIRESPAGGLTAYEIRGAVIALRSDEASKIFIEAI